MPDLMIHPLGGASGDMFLAALIDLGISVEEITSRLKGLSLSSSFCLSVQKTVNRGFAGTRVKVLIEGEVEPSHEDKPHDHPPHGSGHGHSHHHDHDSASPHTHAHGDFRSIRTLIEGSDLPGPVKERAVLVFAALARAEATVHGVTPEEVRFHEVGAMDSIVDIVGSCLALHLLDAGRIYSAPVGLACGHVHCAHGILPLPAPATALLLAGKPVVQTAETRELCTPTGAALLSSLADFSLPPEPFAPGRIGMGLSHRTPKTAPPFLRVMEMLRCGEGGAPAGLIREDLEWLSLSLDDMPAEHLPIAMERLFELGARDVSLVPLTMKKGRSGVELRVLLEEELGDRAVEILLEHTTSFGVRRQRLRRDSLPREERSVKTPWGPVRVKIARLLSGRRKVHVESDDVARIVREQGVPAAEVVRKAEGALP
ncbi:MAG: nickel pincer cofactor biosynthesis protein LarC [Planctomycetes bacterium]|nr:nickel pincer cofactor biosynthesis protein LarC [Planctomycetota bacterium]